MRRLLAAAALVAAGLVGTSAPAQADYAGYRWDGKTVCVENRTSGVRHTAVYDIVRHANANTSLAIWYKEKYGCAGFAQRIYVTQQWRSDWWWSATSFPNGAHLCRTSMGRGTACLNSPVHITFNTRHNLSSSNAHWAAAHELGAALGLEEIAWTCSTVMRRHHSACTSHPHALSWYDRLGTAAHPGLDRFYAW